mgnify:FL=1
MKDNMEDITPDQFELLANYVLSLDEIIMQNTVRQANDILFKQQMEMITQGQQGMEQSQGAPGQQSPMVMDENKTEDIINTNGEVSPQL